MACLKVIAFLAVVVALVPSSAVGRLFDGLAPALAPFYENLCETVNCGKGTCKAKDSVVFSYTCECDPGWKRTPSDQASDYFKFLPCIYPECTFDFSTSHPALPPLPEIPFSFNLTDFDPCSFANCGSGTCKNTSSTKYTCDCNSGYKNLLNVSYFPCYTEHSLGSDCATLGLEVSNAQISANGASQATSFLQGKFHWMIIFIMSIAMALRK